MPIQLSITQPTGVVATYHTVTGGGYGKSSLTATVLSWLDNTHTDAQGFSPLTETQIDASSVLGLPAIMPSDGETFGSAFFAEIDAFLVAQQTNGVNGVFYGGTIVP